MIGYTSPETALLPRVVQKLLSQEYRLILIATGWPTKAWFWDLVKLSLDHPRHHPPIHSLLKQLLNNRFHSHPESLSLHVWYLGVQPSRTKVWLQKWHIELLHLYTSKLSVFQRWCIEEQVDFRAPSIKYICNFMCFLFNEKNRRPSTIEGYRTAIADTLRNTPLDINNNAEIARLIASFHRDNPKSSRSLPKWDLSLLLHQLNQPPFEQLRRPLLNTSPGKQFSY